MNDSKVSGYERARVLVTGAGGFIGGHLCEALVAAGADVRAMVRYNARDSWGHLDELEPAVRGALEVVAGDVRDARFVREAARGCEVVFHLAALIGIPFSYVAPESYVETNVRGTLNVLEAVRDQGIGRMVQTSTSEVYGTARYTPMDEDHPLQAQSPYAASKIGADQMAESFHRSFGLPVVILRPFNVYGPRQSARAVIPTIAAQLVGGRDPIRLGALDPVRDLTFVSDTVRGFLLAGRASAAVGSVIHVGSGRGLDVGELARILMRLAGREVAIASDAERIRPGASEVRKLVAATGRANDLLGWQAEVPLEEGLAKVLAYVRENLARYRTERYAI